MIKMMTHKRSKMVSLGRVPSSNAFRFRLFNYVMDDKPKKLMLLFSGAGAEENVDSCNTRGQTALFVSCITGHVKCVLTLLKLGADTNRRSNDGSTPVHAAAFSCLTSVLQAVVEYGGDLRLHDYQDLLPRDWALEAGSKRSKKVLDMIDRLHNEAVKRLTSTSVTTLKQRGTSGSFSRIIHYSDLKVVEGCSKKPEIIRQGFGDFLSIPFPGTCSGSLHKQFEVGFLAMMPIIKMNQIATSTAEPVRSFQSPPCYIAMSGCWDNQAITIKKVNNTKKRSSRHGFNAHDLLISELSTIRHLIHPHILLLMGVSMEDCGRKNESDISNVDHPLVPHSLIFERVSLGSLYHFLHTKQQRFPLRNSLVLLLQVLDALSYMHNRGFIHCCFSSHAVQLVNIHTAKISDFYYTVHSESIDEIHQQMYPLFNRWLAPEILAEKKASYESDVYSFCAVASETISGVLPWSTLDVNSVRHQIVVKGRMLSLPDSIPKLLSSVLVQGMALSRQKRTLKLKQIISTFKYMLQSGCDASDPNSNAVHHVITRNNSTLRRSSVDGGLDVPDAAQFHASIGGDWQTTDAPAYTQAVASYPKRSCDFGESQQNPFMLHQNSLPPSSRCFSKDAISFELNNFSPCKVGNRQSSVRSTRENKEAQERPAFSDDDFDCIHPDLLSTANVTSVAPGSSVFLPSSDSSHIELLSDGNKQQRSNHIELDGLDAYDFCDYSRHPNEGGIAHLASATEDAVSLSDTTNLKHESNIVNSDRVCSTSILSDVVVEPDDVGHQSDDPDGSSGNDSARLCTSAECDEDKQDKASDKFCQQRESNSGTKSQSSISFASSNMDDSCTRRDVDGIEVVKCISEGGVPNQQLIDEKGPPLHNTVQRVHHSLVELSLVLNKQSSCDSRALSLPSECDQPHEGFVAVDGSAKSTPRECLISQKVVSGVTSAERMFSDDDFQFPCNTANFFEEVISAIKVKNLSPLTKDPVNRKTYDENADGSTESVFTNVLEWGRALKNVPKLQAHSHSCQLAKNRLLRRHVSLQEKPCCIRNPSAMASNVVRRHSDVERCVRERAPANIVTLFSRMEDDQFEGFADACLSEEKEDVPLVSPSRLDSFVAYDQATSVVKPSDVDQNRIQDQKSIENFLVPKSTESSKRRYSITSADLEDIFSDFADRSSRQTVADQDCCDNDISIQQSLTETDHLDAFSRNMLCCSSSPSSCNASTVSVSEAVMISRSCQTENSCKEKLKKMQRTQTSPVGDCRLAFVHAISPPVVNEFLLRTGNWAELLKETSSSVTQTDQIKGADAGTSVDKMSVALKTRSAPNIQLQYGLDYSLSINDHSEILKVKTARPSRPIQPASHMHALETLHPPTSSLHSQSLVSRSNENEHPMKETQAIDTAPEASMLLPCTPSKWSFHNKLSMFESRANDISNCSKVRPIFALPGNMSEESSHQSTGHALTSSNMILDNVLCDKETAYNQVRSVEDGRNESKSTVSSNKSNLTNRDPDRACEVSPQIDIVCCEPQPCLREMEGPIHYVLPLKCPPCDGIDNETVKKKIGTNTVSSDTAAADVEKSVSIDNNSSPPAIKISPASNLINDSHVEEGISFLAQDVVNGLLDSLTSLRNSEAHVLDVMKQQNCNIMHQSCESTKFRLTSGTEGEEKCDTSLSVEMEGEIA